MTRPRAGQAHSVPFTRRRALALLVGVGAAMAFDVSAQSENTIRIIVPSSPGSGTDATGRTLGSGLTAATGIPVVVENIAGASGVRGLQALARAAPDGMTLSVITNNLVITPSVMKAFPFDVTRDFTPIAMLVSIPMVLVVNPAKIRAANAKELIALLKSKPDALNYGSAGAGSVLHLATELFLDQSGTTAGHIPFQGPSPMATALVGGHVDFAVVALPLVEQHIKAGTLRAIGLCSAQRSPLAPDIPTFVEQGMPNYVAEAWVVALGPKGMSPAAVKKTHNEIVQAFNTPVAKDAFNKQGSVVMLSTPEQAQATIRQDLVKYASLVKKIGLEPQ